MTSRRRLISKADLARMAGVSRPAVSKACRGELRAAMVGDRIHLDHPAVVAYLARHGAAVPPPAQPKPKPAKPAAKAAQAQPKARKRVEDTAEQEPAPSPLTTTAARRRPPAETTARIAPPSDLPPDLEIPPDLDRDKLAKMTLGQIARRFGTLREFRSLLDALKVLGEIRDKDDKHRQFEGSVISRELVQVHIFGAIEKLHRHLLDPVPKTTVRQTVSEAKAGIPIEDIERHVIGINETELQACKTAIVAALKKA